MVIDVWLIKLAWRNLWRNKLRTSIMIGAMVFGLMGVASMMGFMTALLDNMITNAIAWQTSHLQIHNTQYIQNPDIQATIVDAENIEEALDENPAVQAWSGRLLADGMIASARSTRGVRINGIDIVSEAKLTPIASHIVDGEWLPEEGRHPVLVSVKTAERLKLRVGSKVVLTFTDGNGEVTGAAFRVKGLFKTPSTSFDDGNVYVRKADLATLSSIKGVHEIAIKLSDDEQLSSVRKQLSATMSVKNTVRDWQQIQPMLASVMASFGVSNFIMLMIFVVAMGFGIVNIMLMSVFERTREFGVLMAVGMAKSKIFILIMFESVLLGIAGVVLGVCASMLLMLTLQTTGLPLGGLAEGLGAFGVDTVLYPTLSAQDYQLMVVTVVITSLFAAIYPARQILKQRPVDAMAEKH
ncbi:ABC transporter permease [Photobacterium sanguinicancri]|uniref:ABC transporter permease n=1 Tax=Photobacterium sanguinicancri TaxID=875932 RepID=A0ABX4FUG5_9GAMM|nr:ABC transporter permease [Photobacterium sanguinicancri]OZS42521.1 ABC transporter permease [Photobacterium sanguinicancri]